MTVELSFAEAKELLERAVAEKGSDYEYQKVDDGTTCVYFNEQTKAPSCIVGHVLAYKGVTLDNFDLDLNASSVEMLTYDSFIDSTPLLSLDEATEFLLSSAQGYQDSGVRWGEAFSRALEDTLDQYDIELDDMLALGAV